MGKSSKVTCLFLDIGGVLLSNGWDHIARARAISHFELDFAETEARHHLTVDTYEEGRLSLNGYLDRVVFSRKRSFSRSHFKRFMFAQSSANPETISMIVQLKKQYGLKVAVVSNEGRELNAHRIKKFELGSFVDFFVCSCFVHIRKPDAAIFQIAADMAQTPLSQILFLENTAMFTEIAEGLGIRSILHTDLAKTQKGLASYGLRLSEEVAGPVLDEDS